MGLDTSHGCWHGAYSAFMRWREKLAEVAGLPPLMSMEFFWVSGDPDNRGYGDQLHYRVVADYCRRMGNIGDAEWLDTVRRRRAIPWASLKERPLLHLLQHSDCDGEIAWDLAGALADDLASLIPLLPDEDTGGHIGNWRAKTQAFIDGLRAAHAAKENVDFH